MSLGNFGPYVPPPGGFYPPPYDYYGHYASHLPPPPPPPPHNYGYPGPVFFLHFFLFFLFLTYLEATNVMILLRNPKLYFISIFLFLLQFFK